MAAPPSRTELVDVYPNPSTGVFKAGIGKFYDYVAGLLGTTGNTAEALVALGATGRLLGVRVFPASTTYIPTTGTTSIVYELIAPGGGGGGAPATGASQVSGGANGGGGGYTVGRATTGFSGAAITIGAPGAAGTPGAAGGNGGTVSLGALATALGGLGGGVASPAVSVNIDGFVGGAVGSGGNILAIPGNASGFSQLSASLGGGLAAGAPGPKGGAVRGQGITGTGVNGLTPTAYGAGGGGAANNASQAARPGGAGGPGVVIIWEYA